MNHIGLRSLGTAVIIWASAILSAAGADASKTGILVSTDLGGKDLMFLQNMVQHGLAQMQLAELAKAQATIPEVKSLAAALATEYAAVDEELRQLSGKKGVQAPTEPSEEEQTIVGKIAKNDGARFDKGYIEEVVRSHRKQLLELEAAAKSSDPQIKAFATELLPVLQEQLALALNFTGVPRPDGQSDRPKSGDEAAKTTEPVAP